MIYAAVTALALAGGCLLVQAYQDWRSRDPISVDRALCLAILATVLICGAATILIA